MPFLVPPGFIDLQDVYTNRVTQVGMDVINNAVAIATQRHNEAMRALLTTFVMTGTKFQEMVTIPGQTELQPLQGESDNPKPVGGFAHYNVAYPIRDAGFAWGTNRKSRAKMTVQEAAEQLSLGIRADARWLMRHALAATFTNVTYPYVDPLNGTLTVQPLANGDTVEYIRENGVTATDTHFLFQAAAIADGTNPFPTIFDELTEHPENEGDVVVYVPTNLKAAVQALTNFVDVAPRDIQLNVATSVVVGAPNTVLGDEVLGKTDNCWIVEWRMLPDNYMIAHTVSGSPWLYMREEPESELQGLRSEFFDMDGNTNGTRLLRTAGFGARNRIGALVYQIGAGAYAIPAGFTAPLPQ